MIMLALMSCLSSFWWVFPLRKVIPALWCWLLVAIAGDVIVVGGGVVIIIMGVAAVDCNCQHVCTRHV